MGYPSHPEKIYLNCLGFLAFRWKRFQTEGEQGGDLAVNSGTLPPKARTSLVFVAIEETLRAAGISEPAAAEIAEVVELALENLRVPQGMTPQAALRRIIGWEVPEILSAETIAERSA